MSDELLALSPLDGRYADQTQPLRAYFSEFALMRGRAQIEIEYLIALSRETALVRPLTEGELAQLRGLSDGFAAADAQQSQEIERATRHDVKAIENFLRARLAPTSLADLLEFLHFGLTSEDINNMVYALALRNARETVLLPALDRILAQLSSLARLHKSTPMLARTHGQPAVPTTFGKELAVFLARLRKQRVRLAAHTFEAKLNGAVGNFNAAVAAAPQVDWIVFSNKFIRDVGLEPNPVTDQILPYDNWLEYFNGWQLTNTILIGLAQDLWHYLGAGYLKLEAGSGEVGSSTMPQKVNPIDLENAEGNLGVANALFEHFARKLPISRLQRDLSDSTVRRTFGAVFGHCLVAYRSLSAGLERLTVEESVMRQDLQAHWEIVAEGAQTILRTAGVAGAYDQLKLLTRSRDIRAADYQAWIASLEVDEAVKARLRALTPLSYVGLAAEITDRVLKDDQK